MVVTAGLDLGCQPPKENLGSVEVYWPSPAPEPLSCCPGIPLSPAPEPRAHLLVPDSYSKPPGEDSWFPTPGHLPVNARPQPAGSESDFLSRVATDSLARLKIDMLGILGGGDFWISTPDL